jgi:hypothetical protein
MLPEATLVADQSGETQDYDQVFTLQPGWNPDNIHAIVFVQRDSNRRSLNAGYAAALFEVALATLDPFSQEIDGTVVPLEWDQQVTYTGATTDDVVVTLDKSALPAGWDAELVHDSTTYPSTFTIPAMSTGEQEPYVVRIISDGTSGIGTVNVSVAPESAPTASKSVDLNAIVNTVAILFVDDDQGASHEVLFENAIADAGYLSVTHPIGLGLPAASYLGLFDAVVWSTGAPDTDTLTNDEVTALRTYLDAGGRLFLSSQGYLTEKSASLFSINYLRVASDVNNVGATVGNGLAGDVLGDGLSLVLAPPFTDTADRINPGSGAVAWLTNQNALPIALHYETLVFKTVYMAAAFEGISQVATASDPNNQKSVMKRILDWFVPPQQTGVDSGIAGASTKLSLAQNAPNPFTKETAVRFALPASGSVALDVYDVSGRKVASLVDRVMEAGSHAVTWNGRDDSGSTVAPGVYLVRLQAGGETVTGEMVRVK